MIWLLFSRRHREDFKRWFRAPTKWWERLVAALAAAIVFAILGLVARLCWAPLPLLPLESLLQTILLWCGLAALAGITLGLAFTKSMLCAVYPFSLLSFEVDSSAS
jgi:hypothetical protein